MSEETSTMNGDDRICIDTDDIITDLVTEIMNDIYCELIVRDENQNVVYDAVRYSWLQVLQSVQMSGKVCPFTMDKNFERRRKGVRMDNSHQWQQIIRSSGGIEDDNDTEEASTQLQHKMKTNKRRERTTHNQPGQPVVVFLQDLWNLFQQPSIDFQLSTFPSASYKVSAVSTVGKPGEWEIPVRDLGGFLKALISTTHSSILSSAIEFVLQKNTDLLRPKRNLSLHHIALCVQNAVIAAEESCLGETEGLNSNGVFVCIHPSDLDGPTASVIDRNAPSSVLLKPATDPQEKKNRQIARKIMSLLQVDKAKAGKSKWDIIRKNVMKKQGVITTEETDLPTSVATNTKAKKKSSRTVSFVSLTSSEHVTAEPDTAALTNIFSLGTPRQLSIDELAHRNDILTILEREEASRRVSGNKIVFPHCEFASDGSEIVMAGPTCALPSSGGRSSTKKLNDRILKPLGNIIEVEMAIQDCPNICSPIKKSKLRRAKVPETVIIPTSSPIQPLPSESTSHLPQIDTSRLSVGVNVVVSGIKKRGPRPNPSRNTRVRLHNYNVHDQHAETASSAQQLSLLPLMSPIQTNSPAKRAPVSIAEDTTGSRNRSYPVRQPTWEPHTSPPRIRNRHFAFTTTSPKKQQYSKVKFMLEERKEQKHDNNEALAAPRRHFCLYPADEQEE